MRAMMILGAMLFALTGCSQPIPTTDFEALKNTICACTDAKCVGQLPTVLNALKHRGGSPEDPTAAKQLLTDATICAVKLDPDINAKIKQSLRN